MTRPSLLMDAHQVGLQATGNETWAAGVVAALENDGGPPTTYAVTAAGRAALSPGIDDDRLGLVSGSSTRRLLLDLPRLARRTGPAAVLVQYTLPPGLRAPGIVAVHDLSFEDPASAAWIPGPSRLRYQVTIRRSAGRARAVLALTDHGRNDILTRYELDPARVLVARPGIDRLLVRALAETPPAPPAAPVVLCVGTVLPRKNIPVIAAAIGRLRREGLPARLRLVGPLRGAGAADLAAVRQTLPPEAVEVLGAVDTGRLAAAYRSSSVLAFPSRYEGFGLPIIEAMHAGLPVISSSATCLPEVVGNAGLLVDPDDVEGWADALAHVLTDAGARADLVAAGRQHAASYSWETTAAAVRRAVDLAAG